MKLVSESKIVAGTWLAGDQNCFGIVDLRSCVSKVVASVLETCFGKHSLEREGFLQSLSRLQTFSENSVYD